MSDPMDTKSPNSKILFQSAFEELAKDFPLNLAPGAHDRRMVGAVLAPASHSSQDTTASAEPTSLAATDDEAEIRTLIENWETLHPDDIPDRWDDLATDPFVGIGPGWIKQVDDEFIHDWKNSEQYREIRQSYFPHNPRRTTISDVRIVFVGTSIASVNYNAEEETQNGRGRGNGSAIVMKTGAGWRIAAITRFDELIGEAGSSSSK